MTVYEQLRLPDTYRNAVDREQCEKCATHLEVLKREAVLSLHSVSVAPFLPKNLVAASETMTADQKFNQTQVKQHNNVPNEVYESADTKKGKLLSNEYFGIFPHFFCRCNEILICAERE